MDILTEDMSRFVAENANLYEDNDERRVDWDKLAKDLQENFPEITEGQIAAAVPLVIKYAD